jgi:ADP-ribose pyrophosphatase YjhB (NUDIX family)
VTDAQTHKKRLAARLIVRDRTGRLLLFRGVDPHEPEHSYWFTAGGGLDEGESFEAAATRELFEETGVTVTHLGAVVHADEVEFSFEGVTYQQTQHYYALEVPFEGPTVSLQRGGWQDYEARSISAVRWWGTEELRATSERFYPERLVEIASGVAEWGSAALA